MLKEILLVSLVHTHSYQTTFLRSENSWTSTIRLFKPAMRTATHATHQTAYSVDTSGTSPRGQHAKKSQTTKCSHVVIQPPQKHHFNDGVAPWRLNIKVMTKVETGPSVSVAEPVTPEEGAKLDLSIKASPRSLFSCLLAFLSHTHTHMHCLSLSPVSSLLNGSRCFKC